MVFLPCPTAFLWARIGTSCSPPFYLPRFLAGGADRNLHQHVFHDRVSSTRFFTLSNQLSMGACRNLVCLPAYYLPRFLAGGVYQNICEHAFLDWIFAVASSFLLCLTGLVRVCVETSRTCLYSICLDFWPTTRIETYVDMPFLNGFSVVVFLPYPTGFLWACVGTSCLPPFYLPRFLAGGADRNVRQHVFHDRVSSACFLPCPTNFLWARIGILRVYQRSIRLDFWQGRGLKRTSTCFLDCISSGWFFYLIQQAAFYGRT